MAKIEVFREGGEDEMPRRPDGRFEGCSGETRLLFEGATFGVMGCSHSRQWPLSERWGGRGPATRMPSFKMFGTEAMKLPPAVSAASLLQPSALVGAHTILKMAQSDPEVS